MLNSNRKIKIAVLSSASGGGAGIAAKRVTKALNSSENIKAYFIDLALLNERVPDDAAPAGNMSNRKQTDTHYTVEFPGYIRGWFIDFLESYDVINVHWAAYLIGLAELDELSRRGKPMLFTLHDFYYITGGCHYPASCDRYKGSCMACPQVNINACPTHIITSNFKIKKRIFSRENVHLAAPSHYLVNEAISSGIISKERAHVLRNPYEPEEDIKIKKNKNTPRIVLIADSLSERRKGMQLAINSLSEAQKRLIQRENGNKHFIVDIIGNANNNLIEELENSGFRYKLHGKISNHKNLAKLLASCNFLLTCSFEDNWPNVLVEAGAYGVVPIVGPGHGCEEFVNEFGVGEVSSGYTQCEFSYVLIKRINQNNQEEVEFFTKKVIETHAVKRISGNYKKVLNELAI